MKHSLRTKTFLLIIGIVLVLSAVSVVVSSFVIQNLVDTMYKNRATDLSKTIAAVLDVDKAASLKEKIMSIYHSTDNKVFSDEWGTPEFEEYIALYSDIEESEEFLFLREQLRSIQDVNDVDCVYLSTIDAPTEAFIYLVDAAYEDVCPPGCIDPLYEENKDLLNDPGIGFLPYITNTEPYGWLISTGVPLYDADNNVICYTMVDISMDYIRAQQSRFTLIYSLILIALTLLISLISIWAVNRAIIRPINLLSDAAEHYSAQQEVNVELDNLPIRSNDEIKSLYDSLLKMSQNITEYITSLKQTRQELQKTRIEADVMNELAFKDALTGVGSILAYDYHVKKLSEEMKENQARYGIAVFDMNDLKKINDTYGHEKGNEAICHTCDLIRGVFTESPVYRFGGDEFVVVIQGEDYDHIVERIRQLKKARKTTNNMGGDGFNAAIGYALYKGEATVEDVFRKADNRMYEEKKKMKEGRDIR